MHESLLKRSEKNFNTNSLYIPAFPKQTRFPPVIYSQQWSPTPSTTAVHNEFLTPNLSPPYPLIKIFPPVAPYKQVLPTNTFSPDGIEELGGGKIVMVPPPIPLPIVNNKF